MKEKEDRVLNRKHNGRHMRKNSTKDIWLQDRNRRNSHCRDSITQIEKFKHKRSFSFNDNYMIRFGGKLKDHSIGRSRDPKKQEIVETRNKKKPETSRIQEEADLQSFVLNQNNHQESPKMEQYLCKKRELLRRIQGKLNPVLVDHIIAALLKVLGVT